MHMKRRGIETSASHLLTAFFPPCSGKPSAAATTPPSPAAVDSRKTESSSSFRSAFFTYFFLSKVKEWGRENSTRINSGNFHPNLSHLRNTQDARHTQLASNTQIMRLTQLTQNRFTHFAYWRKIRNSIFSLRNRSTYLGFFSFGALGSLGVLGAFLDPFLPFFPSAPSSGSTPVGGCEKRRKSLEYLDNSWFVLGLKEIMQFRSAEWIGDWLKHKGWKQHLKSTCRHNFGEINGIQSREEWKLPFTSVNSTGQYSGVMGFSGFDE